MSNTGGNPRAIPPAGAGGFTLMEVLVALAIFAFSAIVLASAYVNVLTSYAIASRSRAADEDASFACSLLLAEPDIDKARDGDQFESTSGRHVTWTATIDPTAIADLFTVVFTCEVADPTQGEPRKIIQTFTLLRPTWSDPLERAKLLQDAKDRIAEIQGKTAGAAAALPPADTSSGGAVGGGLRGGGRGGRTGPNGPNAPTPSH